MLEVCRVLFYTTNAFGQLVNAVYHPAKPSGPKGEQPPNGQNLHVYDWQVILERIKNMDLDNPDPVFPPSPFSGR